MKGRWSGDIVDLLLRGDNLGTSFASRDLGRMLQEWALWFPRASEQQRSDLLLLSEMALDALEADGLFFVEGPVRVSHTSHSRWSPWREALLCEGLGAWGKHHQADRCRSLAEMSALTVMEQGMGDDLRMASFVRYHENGAPPKPEDRIFTTLDPWWFYGTAATAYQMGSEPASRFLGKLFNTPMGRLDVVVP